MAYVVHIVQDDLDIDKDNHLNKERKHQDGGGRDDNDFHCSNVSIDGHRYYCCNGDRHDGFDVCYYDYDNLSNDCDDHHSSCGNVHSGSNISPRFYVLWNRGCGSRRETRTPGRNLRAGENRRREADEPLKTKRHKSRHLMAALPNMCDLQQVDSFHVLDDHGHGCHHDYYNLDIDYYSHNDCYLNVHSYSNLGSVNYNTLCSLCYK
ncbi:hypothetical protein BDY17DRAFT_323858 [Neohortaea acidophila]|uniref:Uncharacterized protein n=1 Tax=Neohortaea acidophila TaxID=245834 RepID=A0A6A6PT87_9PEZI|nr:uncharacterized protein BDY17DRAFT_323858 [Neohortaea acidophila]KAF2483095.1 hypothetical protein BDY17DRAFT_323858 [Neohortaea acidophila]